MISDKSRIQNYIFSKGSEDSKKMVPECDSFSTTTDWILFLFVNYLLGPTGLWV